MSHKYITFNPETQAFYIRDTLEETAEMLAYIHNVDVTDIDDYPVLKVSGEISLINIVPSVSFKETELYEA